MPTGVYIRTKECKLAHRTIPREIRTCICGKTFICKINSKRKFCCSGHAMKGRKLSQKTIDNRKIPLETRTCYCGNLFECMITSERKYCTISCSNRKIITQEIRDNMSRSKLGHITTQKTKDKIGKGNAGKVRSQEFKENARIAQLENWQDPEYRESQSQAIMEGSDKKPNECEKCLFKIVDNLFPNKWLLNTKGEHVRPANKRPDIVNLKEKKCIEHYGDRWHGNTDYWKATETTQVDDLSLKEIHNRDKKRIDLIKKEGWKVLIIWEYELKDIKSLEIKLTEFTNLKLKEK